MKRSILAKGHFGRRGLPKALAARMVADYVLLGSAAKVAVRYGRSRQALWSILKKYGTVKPLPTPRAIHGHAGKRFALQKNGYWRLTQRRGEKEELLHRILWIAAHGPVPAKHEIAFADGDRNNFASGNLICRSIHAHRRAVCLAKYGDANPTRMTSERARARWAAYTPKQRQAQLAKSIHRRHQVNLDKPLVLCGFAALIEGLRVLNAACIDKGRDFLELKNTDVAEALMAYIPKMQDRLMQQNFPHLAGEGIE